MVEVKADRLEQSFEQFEAEDDGVAALKAELEVLKAKIASGAIQAQRPALDGVKSQDANVFTEQYLRRGIDTGLEVKTIGSSSDSIGGYAVPEEIDAKIDSTLLAISPIRSIANVVKVGSAGYRKLIASGGTPSGALNDPPSSSVAGSCYIVGPQPTGAWQGKADHVAAYSAAGWRLIAPIVGLSLLVKQTGLLATYGALGWEVGKVRASQLLIDGTQVVGPQATAIASPVGGATIDAKARSAIAQILAALRSHGLIAEV